MAETNEFYIKIGADVNDAMNKLNQLSSQLSNLASSTQRSANQIGGSMSSASKAISNAFGAMGIALTTAGITSAIIGIGKSALTTAAELEQISVSFEVFTGDAKLAKEMLSDLKSQALKSPMQFQDIAKGAQTLMQYGLAAEQVVPLTKMLGDISGGNADKFSRLALAFGQVNAAGRLMGQEARQMINAGFNPLKAISDATGESMASLTKKMHDGQISVQDVARAFMTATSEGGQFFGMADKQSKTLQGAFNKMSESISFTLAAIGENLNKTFDIAGLTEHISMLVEKLSNNFLNTNGELQKSTFWAESLKGVFTDLALVVDLATKAIMKLGALSETVFGSKELDNFSNWLDKSAIKFAALFGKDLKPVLDYVNNFGKENPNDNIIKRQMSNTGMRKMSDLETWIKQFSNTPSKIESGESPAEKAAKKAAREHARWIADEAQYYDNKRRLDEENKLSGIRLRQWWSNNYTDAYMDLKSSFTKKIDAAKKGDGEYYNLEKEFVSKVGELRRKAQESTEVARNKARKGIMIDKSNQDVEDELKRKQKSLSQTIDSLVSGDMVNRFVTFGQAIYAASKDLGQNIAVGFGEILGNVLAGTMNIESAFMSLGSVMLGAIGDYLIKVGSAAIALGLLQEVFSKIFKNPIGEGGEMGIGAGILAVAVGTALKAVSGKMSEASSAMSSVSKAKGGSLASGGSVASKASGSSYSYGGSSYSTQSIRLAIDLTGAITATQTGYQINKSLETTLRVTGR